MKPGDTFKIKATNETRTIIYRHIGTNPEYATIDEKFCVRSHWYRSIEELLRAYDFSSKLTTDEV